MDQLDEFLEENTSRGKGRPKSTVKRRRKVLMIREDVATVTEKMLADPLCSSNYQNGVPPSAFRDLVEGLLVQHLKEQGYKI